MEEFDVGVVGGGPAGAAAALHLRRTELKVVVIERGRIGGLVWNASRVENYPGFPGGVTGRELAELFASQLEMAGVEVVKDEVLRVEPHPFLLHGRRGLYRCRYLILATGTRPRRLPLRGIPVYYELLEVPQGVRRIAVVGGGDVAFDYALSCADRGTEVFLILRSPPKAHPGLQEEVRQRPEISLFIGASIEATDGGLVLKGREGIIPLEVDGVLGAIGRLHEDRLLKGIEGVKGLHLAGSLRLEAPLRHVGIAVGDGIRAAYQILKEVEG